MKAKRLLSLLVLLFFLVIQITPMAAFTRVGVIYAESLNREFIQAARELINDHWDEAFFSSITLKIGDDKMYVDGEEREIAPPMLEDESIMLPVVDIANAVGTDVHIDKADGQITIVDGEEEKVVYDAPASDMPRSSYSSGLQGEVTVDDNGYKEELLPDGTRVFRRPLVNAPQLEELLNVEIIRDGENVIITKPFQLKQVVLQTKAGAKLTDTYGATDTATDNEGLYLLQYPTADAAKSACELFAASDRIEYAVPNGIVKTASLGWGTDRISAERFKEKLIFEEKLGQEIMVAVVDTGVDVSHPFLQGRTRADIGYDFVDNDSIPEDINGHGTHVSGTVVDCSTFNVKVLPIKVLGNNGSGDDLTISLGIRYAADKGARVINMSFGGYDVDPNKLIAQAVNYAIGKGSVCVAAAGNDASDAKNYSPANVANAITVAATDSSDSLAYFSNFGDVIDVSAPGVEINSCKPNDKYVVANGTSMAAPHVSASVAMLLTDNPALNPSQVEIALRNITVDCGTVGWDRIFGAGRVDFRLYFGENIPPTGIAFLSSTVNLMQNARFKVAASISPADATNKSVVYNSSDEHVAKYEDDGITAKGIGTATITAQTYNGIIAAGSIEVVVEKSIYWVDYAAESFAGGSGSISDPYLIATPEQLAKVAADTQNNRYAGTFPHFKLINDIDLSGKEWLPIQRIIGSSGGGISAQPFEGSINGDNHAIKNMSVTADKASLTSAFFGNIKNSSIRNLAITNAKTLGYGATILAANAGQVFIYNCYTSGKAIGANSSGFIKNLMDLNYTSSTTIENCFSSVEASSSAFIASIVGNTTIRRCYAKGVLSERGSFVDKIIGLSLISSAKITNSFSAPIAPSGTSFIKNNGGAVVSRCYILSESNNNGAIAKDLAFFKDKSVYIDSGNWNPNYMWDFNYIWDIDENINDGFPYLKSFPAPEPFEEDDLNTGTWLDYAAESFAGGMGTKENPYKIETPEQLARISLLYRYGGGEDIWFEITKDIDLAMHKWYPIGFDWLRKSDGFKGNIISDGKVISNINIDIKGDYLGFIAAFSSGVIKGVTLKDVSIKDESRAVAVASLIAYIDRDGEIIDVNIDNTNISGDSYYAGGIVGFVNNASSIINSKASGEIEGSITGGIVGYNGNLSKISGCHTTSMALTAVTSFEGQLAPINYGYIKQCYADDTLIYYNCGIVSDCYANFQAKTNSAIVTLNIGGIITNSYSAASDLNYIYNRVYAFNKHNNIPHASKEQLQEKSFFSGWDFEAVWDMDSQINEGMPFLRPFVNSVISLPNTYWNDFAAGTYAGGNGTENDPYLISTPEQLAKISVNPELRTGGELTYYTLLNDIDLSRHLWQSAFAPSINSILQVNIVFDGNNHTIDNMTTDTYNHGLFGGLSVKALIKDLGMTNVNTTGSAAMVGINSGRIERCYATGSVHEMTVTNNKSGKGATSAYIGGLVGSNSGTIEQSFSKCSVSGSNASGLVGHNSGYIIDCFAVGEVFGSEYSNGIAYQGDNGEINRSYAAVDLIGHVRFGLCNQGKVNDSYYDKDVGPKGENQQETVGAKTTDDMKEINTFCGWDFENTWAIDPDMNESYPYLRNIVKREVTEVTFFVSGGKLKISIPDDRYAGNILLLIRYNNDKMDALELYDLSKYEFPAEITSGIAYETGRRYKALIWSDSEYMEPVAQFVLLEE